MSNNVSANNGGANFVAKVDDKSVLRSVFHLLVGKPDSSYLLLDRAITIEPKHLYRLNEKVQEKLRTHYLEAIVVSATIINEDKTVLEFGGWAAFEEYDWENSKTTKEVRLKWEFLLSVQGYDTPQKHNLNVRISAHAKPIDYLHAVFSKGPEEFEYAEEAKFSPVSCRVDFISSSIGEELLNVVEKWNEAIPAPRAKSKTSLFLKKHRRKIAFLVDYTVPIFFTIAALVYLASMLQNVNADSNVSNEVLFQVAAWIFLCISLLYTLNKTSEVMANLTFNALGDRNNYSVFKLTSGDVEREDKITKSNNKKLRVFLMSSGFSFFLNLVSGFVIWKFLPS